MLALAAGLGCAPHRDVPPGMNDVPEYLGGASRAVTAAESVSARPAELWRATPGRGTLGAPALGERVVAVASVDRWLYALDPRSGRAYWRHHASSPYATGPVIAGDAVYAAEEGEGAPVTALALRDGKRRWRTRVGDVTAPILVAEGRVFGATRDGAAFALRAADGRPLWRREVGGRPGAGSLSGPVLVGGRLVLVTVADSLVVLDARSGRIDGKAALPAGVAAPLARLDDSTVAVASPAGLLLAVALPGGRVRWRVPTGAPVAGAPIVAHDTVYALTSECTLWTVPARAPERAGATAVAPPAGGERARCATVAGPALVRGGVLVATVSGDVVYFDRVAGRAVWTRQAGGELRHPPSILNGQVVVAPVIGPVVSFR
ncbi:MAG: PQQ-binding-like beta-propeller repeat protein [Gemmatimonadaceae bacterium]